MTPPRLPVRACPPERLRPKAEAFNTWAEAHQGQQGDFQDAREAIGMISALMGESVAAMRENDMAPAEYRFVEKVMREARREAESKGGGGPLADEAIVARVRGEVKDLCSRFPMYADRM